MRYIIFFSVLLISCGDEETKNDPQNNSSNNDPQNNSSNNDQNNSSEAYDCIENDDCTAEDPQFKKHPGGFEEILCIEGFCVECINNSDCGVGAFCHPGGYCNKID